MSTDQTRFEKKLPAFASGLFKEFLEQGFSPIIVGGTVRDFFLTGEIGRDWDIELTHDSLSWDINSWKDLGRSLQKWGRVTYLPYDVIRLEIDSYQLEFSPPRVERFTEENHHKNFSVEFDYQLGFEKSVKRRDFTLNAMGMRLKTGGWEFLDPLNGLLHLREKVLHPCSEDFPRDPVRFLRALRFQVRFNLAASSELQAMLDGMKVNGFSPAYLWNEMQKSRDPVKFLSQLCQEGSRHPEIRLPVDLKLSHHLQDIAQVLPDTSHHEAWMVALEWVGLSSEKWCEYFSLGLESARRLSRWAQNSKSFRDIHPETFHGEFEEIRERSEFLTLFDWYFATKQIHQKNPQLPLLKMIEEYLPEWIHLYRFEPVKDVKHIEPPFRAKYQVWNLCQRL